jgi:hypothetical protein
MGFAPETAVATPEVIGVLAWWATMLAVPVMLVRRRRRRRRPETQPDLLGARPDANVASVGGSAASLTIAPARGGSPFERPRSSTSATRLAEGTLEPLCRYVDFRRRLEFAAAELERRLSALPPDRWRIEPYPLTGERRNTLMVLGVTGVFVISATYPPGSWDDVVTVSRLAGKIQMLLPGYAGQVQPAICHPFASLEPRVWYRADEHGSWVGAWLVGGESLIGWLEHCGRGHGLDSGDLERFDAFSEPNWMRPAIVAAPTWPPLPGAGQLRPQE